MILTLLYARRSSYSPDPGYRRDAVVDTLRKSAFKVSHHFYLDQIEQMDPVLRHDLRLETQSEPPE